MPNIIEQQDLLKGLPDARLSMLMQNPTGDIPPFLVAAEAQRRQSIREQFSGGPQESVVDTLTKQLASVPQNIEAPMQTPPQMPPPQMRAGIDALQQGMRRGGFVQRYQSLGLVVPNGSRVQEIANQYGMTVEDAARMLENNPDLSGQKPESSFGLPPSVLEQNVQPYANPSLPPIPVLTASPEEVAGYEAERMREQKYLDMDSYPGYQAAVRMIFDSSMPGERAAKRSANASIPPDPNIGKRDSSFENKAAISIEERKKRLESIFGVNAEDREYVEEKLKELYGGEISSWEKAQKWFDAAQAAIKPGQSNMQAAINALSALGGGYAQERAEERANNREMQQALLKYELGARQDERQSQRDIAKGLLEYEQSEIDRVRANEAASAEREIEGYKWQAQQEIETARMYKSAADDLSDNLNRRVSDLMRSGIVSPEEISKDTEIMDLTKRIEENNLKANNAVIRSRMLQRRFGGATGSLTRTEYADGDTMGYLD
jgi:hypothetical protein